MTLKRFFRSLLFFLCILFLFSNLTLSDTYRIREGDLLAIHLWEEQYYHLQRVRHDGMIHLPPYGDLFILHLTPDAARDLVAGHLKEYYPDSQVVVEVKEISAIEVSIMGAVNHPGLYPLPYGSQVYHAVTKAGGLTREAHPAEAHINRNGYLVPLGNGEGHTLRNYSLRRGDVIYIPHRNNQIHFLGEVENPGSFPYAPGLTLLKGLIAAGGITWRGDGRDVLILRQEGELTDYIEVNVQEILDQKAPDPRLEPGDTIMVGGKALLELTNLSFVLITVPLLLFVLLN